MTLLEILLIILVIIIIVFILYWFFQGSSGRISWRRPVESRVDEYLDRRFAEIIDEWGVVRRPAARRFNDERNQALDTDESRISELKDYENEMNGTLTQLEARLDALEKTLDSKKP
jgi:hypothetical protein